MLLQDAKRLDTLMKTLKSGDEVVLSTEDIEQLMERNKDLFEVPVQRADGQGFVRTEMLLPRAITQEALLDALRKARRL